MNYVEFIGVCREVSSIYIILEDEQGKRFQMFFSDDEDTRSIELNVLTKIEGYLDIGEFPFPIVKIDKVYQIKNNVN